MGGLEVSRLFSVLQICQSTYHTLIKKKKISKFLDYIEVGIHQASSLYLISFISFLLGAQNALLSCCGIDECELTDMLSVDAQVLDKHPVCGHPAGFPKAYLPCEQLLKGLTQYTRPFYPVSWLMRGPD